MAVTFKNFDSGLDRITKIAGVLVPIAIWVVGCNYTNKKDASDKISQVAQQTRDDDQTAFENSQREYANLTALLPFLTSGDQSKVTVAIGVYTSEANAKQAPLDLQPTILRLTNQFPDLAAQIQRAAAAGQQQQAAQCVANPGGIYIEVANTDEQLALGQALGQKLAQKLAAAKIDVPVQQIVRIDKGPNSTQLRYYSSAANDQDAANIIAALKLTGIDAGKPDNLNATYLKSGCTPPSVFELWIGENTPLQAPTK